MKKKPFAPIIGVQFNRIEIPEFQPGFVSSLDEVRTATYYIGIKKQGQTVYYFNGPMPIFQHDENDLNSFRYITSQMPVNGNCKQADIVKCFGVSPISVKRWVKRYRESGGSADFVSKKKA